MLVWRVAREPYQAMDGEGARLYGGRWNPAGAAVVYTSTTLALAALEYLVHIDPEDVADDLVAMTVEVPDEVRHERVQTSELPADWSQISDHPACIQHGSAWVERARTAILRVPSAIVPEEENVLINPRHADAGLITVVRTRAFSFDPRLLG